MGTSSLISVVNKDRSLDTVYCNHEGYLAWNGLILYEDYQDITKIRKLLSGGDFGSLSSDIADVDYYNEKESQMIHYKNKKEYLTEKLGPLHVDYHYFFDEKTNKWSVGFLNEKDKFYQNDLFNELKAQYVLQHTTDKFCCIVITDLTQKTTYRNVETLLRKIEPDYHTKLENFIFSEYLKLKREDDKFVYYFEQKNLYKYLSIFKEVLDKYKLNYSITVFDENGLRNIGDYEESSDYILSVLKDNCAECPNYKVFLEQTEETAPSM